MSKADQEMSGMFHDKYMRELNEIDVKEHWRNWATTYKSTVRATTLTQTAKRMEIDALRRTFHKILHPEIKTVLEVGCGNGANTLALAKEFPDLQFTGFDYVQEMIDDAQEQNTQPNLRYFTDDILQANLDTSDIIFTDRCLINLGTDDKQCEALAKICNALPKSGYLIMIENPTKGRAKQNRAREAIGLPVRPVPPFNHFLDEDLILSHLQSCGMEILDIEDFISLHDIVLYLLIPALTDGEVHYDHPLMDVVTSLNIEVSKEIPNAFGDLGQNRLYLLKK